jgi:transposase
MAVGDCEQKLTPRLRWLLHRLWQEWKQTKTDIETVTDELDRISTLDERCQRLRQIPGFGLLVSTAMLAAIGNGAQRYAKGAISRRGLALCLGSTPLRQNRS